MTWVGLPVAVLVAGGTGLAVASAASHPAPTRLADTAAHASAAPSGRTPAPVPPSGTPRPSAAPVPPSGTPRPSAAPVPPSGTPRPSPVPSAPAGGSGPAPVPGPASPSPVPSRPSAAPAPGRAGS
jgi:hypothetical protein